MRIFLETQAKLHIQHLVTQKELELVCSFISRYENNENPNFSNRNSIAQFLVNASGYIGVENMENIRLTAHELIQQGLKMKDATHLACAIMAGCDYFITTDDKLIQKYVGDSIKVRTPLTFLHDLEGITDA